MRTLYVRADADHSVGIGHIMRCIAIAQCWQENGMEVCFLTKPIVDGLKSRIEHEQFQHIELSADLTIVEEVQQIATLLEEEHVLLLDGYHFDSKYQKLLKEQGIKLAVVDDFSHADYYYADVIINRNLIAVPALYVNKKEAYTKLLLGPDYNYVRKEFTAYSAQSFQIQPTVSNLFVNFGGSDPKNMTIKVLELLNYVLTVNDKVIVVIGPAYKEMVALTACLKRISYEVTLLKNADNIAQLMFDADVAITAGGTTLFELSYLGVPNIAIKVTSNQKSIDVFAGKYNSTYAIDANSPSFTEDFYTSFNALQRVENRMRMHKNAMQLIDSKGNQRIVEELLKI